MTNKTNGTKHTAEIYVWSRIGHTPVTGRAGAYCDELVKMTVEVADLAEGMGKLREVLATTPHADKGNISSPTFPNNFRSNWASR